MAPSLKDLPLDLFDEPRIGLERPLQSSERTNDGACLSSASDPELISRNRHFERIDQRAHFGGQGIVLVAGASVEGAGTTGGVVVVDAWLGKKGKFVVGQQQGIQDNQQ